MKDLAGQIFKILDNKKWKTTFDISNELDVITPKLLPILLFGRNRIFVFESPNKWKLCKHISAHSFESFLNQLNDNTIVSEKTLKKYHDANCSIKSMKKTKGNIQLNQGIEYQRESDIAAARVPEHGFNYGKKKTYTGPNKQYWTDTDIQKREWE